MAAEPPASNGLTAPDVSETNGQIPDVDAQPAPNGISADEIALYDRQIRLWGVQAQERIRSAKVLLITVKAVGTEVAKNLILAGISSLTILDNGIVSEDDLGAQYFVREEDIGENRAQAAASRLQELNPRVTVIADTQDPSLLAQSEEPLRQYDLIIASDLPFATAMAINASARLVNKPFYATGVHGFYGYIFADLISHEYIIERAQPNVATKVRAETPTRTVVGVSTKKENGQAIELVTKREIYSPIIMANSSPLPAEYLSSRRRLRAVSQLLPCLRALWTFERQFGRQPDLSIEDLRTFTVIVTEEGKNLQLPDGHLTSDFLRAFIGNIGSEIVPTAAFVGGRLAEDAINVLGRREQPIQNFVFFDGDTCTAPVYALHPIFDGEAKAGFGPALNGDNIDAAVVLD